MGVLARFFLVLDRIWSIRHAVPLVLVPCTKVLVGDCCKPAYCAGGRYDGLMKAVWQAAGVASSPPPSAAGLTVNADRLVLLASARKTKPLSSLPLHSQVGTACSPALPCPALPCPGLSRPFCPALPQSGTV